MQIRRWCALGLVAGIAVVGAPTARADVSLEQAGLSEVTGVAWDPGADRLFVADRTGKVASLEADGRLIGQIPFSAQTSAVEGIAVRGEYLYIGDIGDSSASRSQVTVYRVPAYADTTSYRAWDFVYPDGPQDARALLISGKGRVYIVTAGNNPGVYRSGDNLSREGTNELIRMMDAPAGVSDGTFMADGTTMLLRTSTGVTRVDALKFEITDTTTYTESPPDESITQLDGARMLVGGQSGLRAEPLPKGETSVTPQISAAPETTPPATAAAPTESEAPAPETAAPEVTRDANQGVNRSGTLWALAGAAAVSVLAGLTVFVRRD